jgi:methyl-accepting chemotaxis protein
MTPRISYRTLGKLLIIFASLGLLFSIAGIISSWAVKPWLQRRLLVFTEAIDATLINTDKGLIILDSALDNINENLEIIISSLDDLDDTVTGISTSLDSSAKLVGDDLRQTIIDTQVALDSAAGSAEIIDKTLSIIAAIPFLGANYQPEVPLHTSLDTVASNMDGIPESLESMEKSLSTTSEDLTLLYENFADLSGNLENFQTDLEDAQDVMGEYQKIINNTEDEFSTFNKNLPRNLTLFTIIISGILFSIGIAQCVTLFQGIAFIEGEKRVVNLADITRE